MKGIEELRQRRLCPAPRTAEAAKRRRDRAHRIAGDVAGIAVRALAQPELGKGNAVEVVAIAAEGMAIAAADPPPVHEFNPPQLGKERCRERVRQCVDISVVAESLKKKKQ